MTKCECPDAGMEHGAGRCPRGASYRVRREGVEMTVCVDCILSRDTDRVEL